MATQAGVCPGPPHIRFVTVLLKPNLPSAVARVAS